MSNSSPGCSVCSIQASTTISLMSEHVECLPPHPALPVEIWDMIRRHLWDEFSNCKSQDDLVHMWTCVRPMCKEFKATIEDIFKTRHLAKTVLHFITDPYFVEYDTFSRSRADVWAEWQRAPLDHVEQHVFRVQLRFAELREAEPGRAVFKLQHRSDDPNDPENVYEGAIFRHMREKGGLGPMGEGDKYKPSERRRLFGESEGWGPPSFPIPILEPVATEGMFVVQVRAGLNDCAVPGLKIDQEKREISFNWIELFSRMFSERRAVQSKNLGIDGGLRYSWPPAKQCPQYKVDPPLHGGCVPGYLDPALIDLATRDYRELSELSNEIKNSAQVIERLLEPVPTWRDNTGRFVGEERLSIGSLRLKRNCDREVTLDDEGEIDNTRANLETLRMGEKINDWLCARRQRTCDACRLWNQKCMKRWSFDRQGYVSGCEFCFKNHKRCTYRLAKLNNDWLPPSIASISLADPVLSPQATGGLTPPNTMRSTQGSGMAGQEQEPNSAPIAEHSLSGIRDLVLTDPETVALCEMGDPSCPCGNLPHTPPDTPPNPPRYLSRPVLPVTIAPITEDSLGAEDKSGEDYEAKIPMSREKDTMRQVMESRGLGISVIAMGRRNERSDSGPAPNRRESRGVGERDHGPNTQGPQTASTQGSYMASSQKWCGGQPQDQGQPSCSTQGSQKISRKLSMKDRCEHSHDLQLLYFKRNTQINAMIQHRLQGTKSRGKQSSSTQINSCIIVALEHFALASSRSTPKMRRVLSSHAANLQVISTHTRNLKGRSIRFKDPSYLPSNRRTALLPNLPSWPDPRSDSSTMEARCPQLKDLERDLIAPCTNIDRHQSCSYDILHLKQQNFITLSSPPQRPDLLDLQYATSPSITVLGPDMPTRSALGSTPRSTGQVARDVILMQPGRVYMDHPDGDPAQQSNTVPSSYRTNTIEPLVAQIIRTLLPTLVPDPTALKTRFTKADTRKMIAWALDKIYSFDSQVTTVTIAGQALAIQDEAVRFGRQSLSVALSILRLPHATRSRDQRIMTNGLSFAFQTGSDKFILHLMLSATFRSGSREQDGYYRLLASFDGFSNQAQRTRSPSPQNANCNRDAPNTPPVRSMHTYRSFASTPQTPRILNRDPPALSTTGAVGETRWVREHNTNDEERDYDQKIHPHTTYTSVLVSGKKRNPRCRRDDTSVMTGVETGGLCVLRNRTKSAERPPLCQTSNDLKGSQPQSYFNVPSCEDIPHFMLFNLATLPRSDRNIVQGIIDAEQRPKLQAVLSRHTFTAFVADSGHLCDYLLAPPMSFWKRHTAEYRIHEVSLRPETGPFTAYKSAASNTANPATRSGDILIIEGFKNSIKTAFKGGKGTSILPRGFSVQSPVHSSIQLPIQNILSRGREISHEPETPGCNYTGLKDLGRTYTRDNNIAAETWHQKIIAEEEAARFHLTRAVQTTIERVDRCESDLGYGSGSERSYLLKGSFSDRSSDPQVFINYRDSCPSGNDPVLRAGCCHSRRTLNLSFDMELPSASMQKSSAGDIGPQFYSTGDALSKTDEKGGMQWTIFSLSFKSWASVIIKQYLYFSHRPSFLPPLLERSPRVSPHCLLRLFLCQPTPTMIVSIAKAAIGERHGKEKFDHNAVRIAWLCVDISSKEFISSQKAHDCKKPYEQDYNLAAHLQLRHFYPHSDSKVRRIDVHSEARQRGNDTGKRTSTSECWRWLKKIQAHGKDFIVLIDSTVNDAGDVVEDIEESMEEDKKEKQDRVMEECLSSPEHIEKHIDITSHSHKGRPPRHSTGSSIGLRSNDTKR